MTLVVAFPPGASTDVTARRIAPRASAQLGQALVVENRTGAAGNLAAGYVARAAADGYTLLHTNYISLLIAKADGDAAGFRSGGRAVPVAQIGPNVNMLVVRADLPVRTLPELVALARREPERLTMGTIGIGSAYHMGLEWLNLAFGTRITHVPYRGAAEAVNDLLGGRVGHDVLEPDPRQAAPGGGQDAGDRDHQPGSRADVPGLPTIAEQGVPGFDLFTQTAIFAPARHAGRGRGDDQRRDQCRARRPRMPASSSQADGVILTPMTPAAFQEQIRASSRRSRDVFARTGIKLE